MFVVVRRRFHAQIVVAAEIDLVVRRGLFLFAQRFQILVLTLEVAVRFLRIGLDLLERQRLLGLEDRFRILRRAAIDAGDGIVLFEVVEARGAFRTRTLRAPFRLDHAVVCLSEMGFAGQRLP